MTEIQLYIPPKDVISPKKLWSLIDVLIDGGEYGASYAFGLWHGKHTLAFRWNGGAETGKFGTPQIRGLPTWMILDPKLTPAVIELVAELAPEKLALIQAFFPTK